VPTFAVPKKIGTDFLAQICANFKIFKKIGTKPCIYWFLPKLGRPLTIIISDTSLCIGVKNPPLPGLE
jgi:hypothetical protein